MGRKRKQVDLSELANLPPCRVCDAPGAGFHYGVNTCEACKGFFHRSLKIHGQYKCTSEGDCVIEHGNGKLCQLCRYHKCLSVGMAKEAIKTGRYTSAKRTNDILEIKKIQKLKTGSSIECEEQRGTSQTPEILNPSSDSQTLDALNPSSNSSSEAQSLLCSEQQESSQFQDLSVIGAAEQTEPDSHHHSHGLLDYINQRGPHPGQDCDHSSMDCSEADDLPKMDMFMADSRPLDFESIVTARTTEKSQELQTPDSVFISAERPELSLTSLCETLAPMKPTALLQVNPATTVDFLQSPPSFTYSVPFPAFFSASTYKEIPQQRAQSSCSPFTSSSSSSSSASRLSSPSASSWSPSPGMSSDSFSSSRATVDFNFFKSGTSNNTSPATPGASSCFTEPDIAVSPCHPCYFDIDSKSIEELYMDKDAAIKMIVDAHDTYLMPMFGIISEEDKERQQKAHLEECKLRREMFGPLYKMPDHEYDFIFATTGLDADDRQKHLRIISANMEKNIQGIVKFAQHIPGFSKVDIGDKVNLIKYSGHEVCGFTLLKYVNFELKIFKGVDMEWKCEYDFGKCFPGHNPEMFQRHFNFWRSIDKLKLTDDEMTIVKAILIMSPDRDRPVDSPVVREIHLQLTECLIHLLSKRVPEPLLKFAKILDRLTESRTHTMNMTQTFRKLGIQKYSNFEERPLVKEMMSGIFFDVDEETQ